MTGLKKDSTINIFKFLVFFIKGDIWRAWWCITSVCV